MNILHLQLTGNPGGIVSLTRDFANNSSDNNIMYFIVSGGTVAEAIESEGHQVVIDNVSFKNIKKGAKKFSEFCIKNNIDVVINHMNNPIAIILTYYAVREKNNLKWIMYFHSDPKDNLLRRKILHRPFIKYQIKHSDARIAISEHVRKSAASFYHTDINKIDVVYNGVDISKFQQKKVENVDVVTFIYVGRLFPSKGVQVLIDALQNLRDLNSFRLLVVGRGPQQEELENTVRSLGLEDKVSFLGSRMDVPDLLLQADYFVHPAIWNEGFGITLIEAMSVGLPCVAFSRGAIPEIIDNERNGYLIDQVDTAKLANVLRECITIRNTDSYINMVENAKKTANKFNISNMIAKMETIIER